MSKIKLIKDDKQVVAFNTKMLLWTCVFIFIVFVMITLKEVSTLLIFSYLLALIVDPVLDRYENKPFSRSTLIIITGAFATAVLLALIAIVIPSIIIEAEQLIKNTPEYLNKISISISEFVSSTTGVSIEHIIDGAVQGIIQTIKGFEVGDLKKLISSLSGFILQGYSVSLTILNLFLLPFFFYYLARDIDNIHDFIGDLMEPKIKQRVSVFGEEAAGLLQNFFKGQMLIATIMAILYSFGLYFVGLPYAIPIGVMAGYLNVVPYLGLAIGLVTASSISLVTTGSLYDLAYVVAIFIAVQTLEGSFLTPKIVGDSVGLHPLVVMVALIVGGQIFGLLGIILAVPAAAIIWVLFKHLKEIVD